MLIKNPFLLKKPILFCITLLSGLTLASKKKGLACYCENYCPDTTSFNGTCTVSKNSYCFSAVELVYDVENAAYREFRTFGCLGPNESGLMQCRAYLIKHARPKNISCCRENMCNINMFPVLNFEDEVVPGNQLAMHYVLTLVLCFLILLCLLAAIVWFRCYRRIKAHLQYHKRVSKAPAADLLTMQETDSPDQSSGSGSGLPRLVQLTIGKQIQLCHCIGKGRYGEVHLGMWRGEAVAVKVFASTDEASWRREKETYQTVLLRHDNVLGFIAADIRSSSFCTQMLLITDYHPLGSLYDYLQMNVLDSTCLVGMLTSIISGISHLHTEIFGTKGKPAIAHRDIKTKNILVKRNLECCIADFGLAVKYNSESNVLDLGSNPKVGTRRYMAPEVLNGTINLHWFEALKSSDIYSFSLVMWEVCRRCVTSADNQLVVDNYELPFQDFVPSDPSFEDMHLAVCVKGIRPSLPNRWNSDHNLMVASQTMLECWSYDPNTRLTHLRIKKTFKNKFVAKQQDDLDFV